MAEFTRFSETILKKKDARIVSVKVSLVVTDCTGIFWFTDVMAQEGDRLTGYVINTETLTEKYREDGEVVPKRFYNGIVRSEAALVILNRGADTAGLDFKVYPIQTMEDDSIVISQGAGSHKAKFVSAVRAGDEFALLASTRQGLRNGSAVTKEGFFQYSAAGDSKHPVTVEKYKSARVYVEFQETQDGG
ncbi:MAG: hypothetical protein IJ608_05485 [Lachnospiraceae bacterium]|nr:hypothetical protein [Lachnospiraceae bacterium]